MQCFHIRRHINCVYSAFKVTEMKQFKPFCFSEVPRETKNFTKRLDYRKCIFLNICIIYTLFNLLLYKLNCHYIIKNIIICIKYMHIF